MKRKSLLFLLLLALGLPWAANAQSQLNEGFESTTFPPEDWASIHVSGANSWARYTTYKHSGDASVYAHWASSGHENYLITPKLVPASDESLSFYVAAQSYSGTTLYVKVSTTTADASAFSTTLATYTTGSSGTIGTTSPSTWVEKTIDLSDYVGQQIFIAFHVVDNNGGDVIIDDVTGVTLYVASCAKPIGLAVNNGVATWNAGTASQWNLKYKKVSDETWISVNGLTAASYTFSGLDAATDYEVQVQTDCGGGDLSDWTNSASFTTPCEEITSFPWTEDFTGLTAGIPICWDNSEGTTTTASYKWSYNNAGHTAAPCLRFNSYSNSSNLTNFLKTPVLNFPANKEMQLVFWWKNPTGGDFSVFISTDGGSTYTTSLATALTSQSDWTKEEIDLTDYVGSQNVVIVFKGTSNYGSGDAYIYLDDVTVREKPNCLAPTALAAVATANSAELSWTANSNETAWTVYYKKATDETYTEVANATNPYTLNGLTAATNYQYYVVANCSADDASEPSNPFTFATECDVIAALGYTENFDSYTDIPTSYTPSYRALPNCWNYINTCSNSSYMYNPTVTSYSSSSYAYSGSNYLRLYSYYSSYSTDYGDPQPQYAILPEMSGLAGTQVNLMARGYNATSTFKIGTMSDPTDASTFTMIAEQELTASYPEEAFEYIIPATCTDSYLAIMIDAATSSRTTNGVYIDNIEIVEAPTCLKPTGLEVTDNSITAYSVELSWTENGEATAWQIELTDIEENVVVIDADSNPFTLTELTPESMYAARVRAYCDADDQSKWSEEVIFETVSACPTPDGLAAEVTTNSASISWSGYGQEEFNLRYSTDGATWTTEPRVTNPYTLAQLTPATTYYVQVQPTCANEETWSATFTFTTLCESITTLPWSENFEDFANNTVPMCWDNSASTPQEINSSPYYIWGVYNYNNNNMIRMNNYFVHTGVALINSPMIELPAEGVYQLSFDYAHTASCGAFKVNISEDNGTTWVELGSYAKVGSSTSYTDPGTFTSAEPIILANYVGKTVMLQFLANANYGNGAIFIDNILIDAAPSCLAPNALGANTDTDSAELSWTANSSETKWTLYWKASGASEFTEVSNVTENPYTLEGLNPATVYEFYVVANCSDEDASEPSATFSFTTECDIITITAATPYTQDFEAPVVTSAYNSTEGLEVPACWENPYTTSTSDAGKPHIIAAGSSYNYATTGQVLNFYGSGSNYVTLPEFSNALNALQISFKYATESSSNGTLALGYITANDEDYNTFTEIETFAASSASYHALKAETVGLNNVPATATRLAFRWTYTNQWSCNIDDVEVALMPTFTKTIEAHNNDGGWYLIASPLNANVAPDQVANLVAETAANYDLYSFDQTAADEWYNYKAHTDGFVLEPGKGYLYANAATVDLVFTGVPYSGNGEVDLEYSETNDSEDMRGWNLIGNPFSTDATVDMASYRMSNSNEFISTAAGSVEAMEGLLVQATATGQKATFTPAGRAANETMSLALNLSQNNKLVDRAIVSFNEGNMLPKLQLNPNHTKVYIPQDNKDYAVVYSEGNGEMPVSFKTEKNGSYTFAVNAENVVFSYLHLIDNMTGADVDLLATPSYSFDAKTTDYESRFRLVFATGNSSEDSFAFFSNGSFVINNEGNATLQVVDVMGRILKSETINGCANVNVNAAPGVYMLRLINGDNVKVQKVVVK